MAPNECVYSKKDVPNYADLCEPPGRQFRLQHILLRHYCRSITVTTRSKWRTKDANIEASRGYKDLRDC